MKRAIVALALLLAAPASAQHLGDALDDPSGPSAARPTRRARAGREGLGDALATPSVRARPRRAPPPVEEPPTPYLGPQIQLGYSFYRMADGYGGGDVNAGSVGIYIKMPIPELRLGLIGELGVHDYSLGEDGLIVRGAIDVGFQLVRLLDPLVPHASFIISFGTIVGERFDTTIAYAFGGAGIALGAELRLVRDLHIGLEGSYLRHEMDGAAFDVFMLRILLGF